MKTFKTIMVTLMAVAIVALSYICYYQHGEMAKLKTHGDTMTKWYHETMDERNELRKKNTEYEDLYDLCSEYFNQYTEKYSEQAMNLASHNPQATIGYVLIFVDGNVRVGACNGMDGLEEVIASYDKGSILTANYWYA